MIVIKTAIPDVLILEPKVFGDERGFFFVFYNQQTFEESIGRKVTFVQDNHSKSKKNVLRGLHFQRGENAQGKLVRCAVGEVFDVAVDIRKESPTFGQWVGVNYAEFLYKATNYYSPSSEGSILWNDETIGIEWPFSQLPELSAKDAAAPLLHQALLTE